MKKIAICLFIVLLVLFISACKPKEIKKQPDEVTLQLKYIHQAQFAGIYVAKDKGYYDKESIDIKLVEGEKDTDIVGQLLSGQADFAITSPENLIISCSQGKPVKAIAAIYRRSPVAFVSMADSQIVKPNDFIGKKLAVLEYKDSEIQFYAMMKKLGIDISKMNLMPWNPDYTEFYNGNADVTFVYLTASVIKMQQKGYELNVMWPGDYGIKFYSDILITTDNMISKNPELVTRFLKATLKGWEDAVGDSISAVETTLKYAFVKDNNLQTAMMDAQAPLINTGEDHIGWMKAEDWQSMYEILLDQKLINTPMDYNKLFTVDFLNKIYQGKTE